MALVVADASVIIALLDADDALHEASRDALRQLADADLRLPATAYSECLVRPARAGLLDVAIRNMKLIGLSLEPVTAAMAERAAVLRAQHSSLRLPDALVIATADVLQADSLITADKRWQSVSARVLAIG